jgi:cytochrome P450
VAQAQRGGGDRRLLIDDDWVEHHFDYLSPALARDLHPTLARARTRCPVARSDQHGGYWTATDYEHVLQVAQDWQTFSYQVGISVLAAAPPNTGDASSMKIYPVTIDPPLQRTFKRLINTYFTAAAVSEWEQTTRELVHRLVDGFIACGECDFMAAFARPFPGLAFFDLALHAPADDLYEINRHATAASLPDSGDSLMNLAAWITGFVEARRREGPGATSSTRCSAPRSRDARSPKPRPSARSCS